jgi:hypothetical protein
MLGLIRKALYRMKAAAWSCRNAREILFSCACICRTPPGSRALALGACGFGARHLWDSGQPPPPSWMRGRACRRGSCRLQFAAPDVSVYRRARAMHHVPEILGVLQRKEAHVDHRQLRRLESVRHDEDPAFADVNELEAAEWNVGHGRPRPHLPQHQVTGMRGHGSARRRWRCAWRGRASLPARGAPGTRARVWPCGVFSASFSFFSSVRLPRPSELSASPSGSSTDCGPSQRPMI